MMKNWLLLLISVVATLGVSLGLIRWLAPGLLGVPVDLQMVRTAKEVPPFYKNIFREEDYSSDRFLINDPAVITRARPLYPDKVGMGPHDVLGFRNRDVPNVADVVAIGDSQTYGNNAPLEFNWPSQLGTFLGARRPVRVYNISVGAWGGVNYLEMLDVAVRFRPRAVVVAFYTGNDPLSDFRYAYSLERWQYLIPDESLTVGDLPRVRFPPPPEETWTVTFEDGLITTFTPRHRYHSNRFDSPVVRAGYRIMARVAEEIRDKAVTMNIVPVFIVIPTKELAYAKRVREEGIGPYPDFDALVRDEARNIAELSAALAGLENAHYVDVVTPLQEAAMTSTALYPASINGHPVRAGYRVIAAPIARTLEAAIGRWLTVGLVVQRVGSGFRAVYLVTEKGKYLFENVPIAVANGWSITTASPVTPYELSHVPTLGIIDRADPDNYGPEGILLKEP